MHSAGDSRHGHRLPGQVGHGKDRRLRAGHPTAAGAWRSTSQSQRSLAFDLPFMKYSRNFAKIYIAKILWCVGKGKFSLEKNGIWERTLQVDCLGDCTSIGNVPNFEHHFDISACKCKTKSTLEIPLYPNDPVPRQALFGNWQLTICSLIRVKQGYRNPRCSKLGAKCA